MRAAGMFAFVLVLCVQLVGISYVLFDAFWANPALRSIGIETNFDDRDRIVVKPLRADVVSAGIKVDGRIQQINGTMLGDQASSFAIARALIGARGDIVVLTVRNPDGRLVQAQISRTAKAPLIVAPNPIPIGVRMGVRLFFTLISSLALLGSAFLLFWRCPRDTEANLIAFGFLGLAATVDPPLLMWLSIGAGWMINVLTTIWWTTLIIALAAFPDGRFDPKWLRWMLVAAPILGLVLEIDSIPELISLLIGVIVPLALIALQIVRYRRLPPGLARQQIKWAAFGFAVGFVLLGISLGMPLVDYESWSPAAKGGWTLAMLCLFNLSFAIMPLGLLVALVRFRLWDVDRLITRSAAYAALTGMIALTWAGLTDLVKAIVSSVLGQEHSLLSLALGAVLAAGIFAPAQKVVLAWSQRRFNATRVVLDELPIHLPEWQKELDVGRLAMQALDAIVAGVHASGGAIILRKPAGRALIAAANLDSESFKDLAQGFANDPRIAQTLELTDELGTSGWLLLTARSDGASYAKSDLAALALISPALASALRAAKPVAEPETAVQSMLEEMQSRLARLEEERARLT